jgi:outer membrane immunogenic protein
MELESNECPQQTYRRLRGAFIVSDSGGVVSGQIGYRWQSAGWVTDDKYRGTVTATGALFDSASETRWGGVVGTGIEFGFAPNWSVAVEYDHLFMGNHSHNFTSTGVLGAAVIPVGGVFRTDSIRQDVDLITARINYRFNLGGPAVARY